VFFHVVTGVMRTEIIVEFMALWLPASPWWKPGKEAGGYTVS
jgi:hypothetical protein